MTPREGRLIECIRSLILLGENEGPTIAEKCRERLGEHYVAALLELADDFVAELATKQLNAERRRAELEVQPGDPVTSAEMKIAKVWIPGYGRKRYAEVTSSDLRARADYYEMLRDNLNARAEWCRDIADELDSRGLLTMGELDVIPVLELERV